MYPMNALTEVVLLFALLLMLAVLILKANDWLLERRWRRFPEEHGRRSYLSAVWNFKGGPPVVYKLIFAALLVHFVLGATLTFSAQFWGRRSPDMSHPYMVRFKGGGKYFLGPWLGWYVDHFLWLQLGLMVLCALVAWRYRRRLQRVDEVSSGPGAAPCT